MTRATLWGPDAPGPLRVMVLGPIVPYVRVGRERWTRSAQRYHGFKADAEAQMIAARRAADRAMFAAGALAVELVVWRAAQTGDVDNLAKALLDAANGALWRDDAQVVALSATLAPCRRGEDWAVLTVGPSPDYADALRDVRRGGTGRRAARATGAA